MQCAVMIYDSAHYVINFVVPLLGETSVEQRKLIVQGYS